MLNLVVRKLLVGLLTLWVVVSLTFVLLRMMPGGPFDGERKLPEAIKANIEARYHLNEPLWRQYALYMGGLARGDLGPSFKYRSRSVADIVGEATATSFRLGLLAMIFGTSIGTLLGAIAGLTRNVRLDGALTLLGVAGVSTPMFIFGGLLVLVFALWLKWLPAATLDGPRHLMLPVTTLALAPFAYAFLLTRTTVREMRSRPYVFAKRGAGVPERQIAWRHVLRNSLMPLLSILGPMAAAIVTGSFVVETIFAIPGLGRYFVTAVTNRDYTLVTGITLVYGVMLIAFNTLTDLLYGVLDPRLRREGSA